MLRSLTIKRFKSIYEQTLEFGHVNLFVGPNGSGKSNILEAIGIVAAVFSRGLEPSELDLKGIRLSLPHIFKSAFKGHDLPQTFRLEARFDYGRYECSIRAGKASAYLEFFSEALYEGDVQIYGRSAHGIKLHGAGRYLPPLDRDSIEITRSVWSVISPFLDISHEFRDELMRFSRYAIYAPQTAIMRGLAIDNRVVEPLGLTGSGLATALEQTVDALSAAEFRRMSRIIWEPGWARSIEIGNFNPEIVPSQVKSDGRSLYIKDRYMRGGRNMLSAFDASEGTLYLVFVAALLGHPETPLTFALDNVDGTLNPRLVRKLTDHIVDVVRQSAQDGDDRQVFMTSHHPSALDSIDIFDKSERIFVCNRAEPTAAVSGATFFRPLEPPKGMDRNTWAAKHGGNNLSELLLEGRIKDAL
ncbi:AAA family ATPase [uncultured Sphingomonas sp.]|uniref:AAA family ATPase n=1 Tax=uncultured Sphingomonas sp. TaxID=158754 RepID=UPI0025F1E9F4|nr:AAA family ATPase [uncultured Sphingomonas sp.]